ncbi:HNH endonuclease [Labrenzia sp. THAF82]|nr:HNH endonuclease [Labrenzia sp. THAF82]
MRLAALRAFFVSGWMAKLTNLKPLISGVPSRVRSMPKVTTSIYRSREWKEFAADVKRERGSKCERCGSTNRVIADHIKELKDGGAPFDRSNIELLCHAHHQQKTAEARKRRATGIA